MGVRLGGETIPDGSEGDVGREVHLFFRDVCLRGNSGAYEGKTTCRTGVIVQVTVWRTRRILTMAAHEKIARAYN